MMRDSGCSGIRGRRYGWVGYDLPRKIPDAGYQEGFLSVLDELRSQDQMRGDRTFSLSSPSGDHVLRLYRWGLVPPAGALVAEDRRHLLVAELVGERRHRGTVGHAADGLA